MTRDYSPAFVPGLVPAAITAYDLPDLAASVAPRGIFLAAPLDGSGAPADDATIAEDTSVIARAFAAQGATRNLVVLPHVEKSALHAALTAFLNDSSP
jgi:hypothetical protein